MEQTALIEPNIRLIGPDDSIAELTLPLHRVYAPLAERGMRFLASHQDESCTRKRMLNGECYLAMHNGRMIGTIVWHEARHTGGSPWLEREDVASFSQYAVEPAWQGRGIGSRLLAITSQKIPALPLVPEPFCNY
jgi:GNAT superfamily N-acetyltransferase